MKARVKIVLIIVVFYIILHSLILLKAIPYTIVWGGKISSPQIMCRLEIVALITMLFLGFVVIVKSELLKIPISKKIINRILLLFSIFFLINTLGNLLAETILEKAQAIITIYLSFACYKISKT